MKKILVLLAALFIGSTAHAADFSDAYQLYGWNGAAQFFQTWADHKVQINDAETDQVWTASDAFGISTADIANWDGKEEALICTADQIKKWDSGAWACAEDGGAGSANISDVVYGVGWNGDTTDGASKNALYDKIELLDAAKQPLNANLTDLAAITGAQGDILYFDGSDWVKLIAGISGQYLQTLGAAADPQWASTGVSGDIEAVGDVTSGEAFTEAGLGNNLYFEATANTFEVKLTAEDPGADFTVTIPAATTTLVGKDTTDTLTNKTLTSPVSNTADINTPDIDGGTVDAITSLTAANDIDLGAHEFRAETFESDVTTGTAPFTVASTTVVGNLNVSFLEGNSASAFQTALTDAASLYATLSDVTAFLEDLSDDTTPSLGGDLAVGANEIQSAGNIVLQLGDAAGANYFEVQDSAGALQFKVDSDGGLSQSARVNPTSYFNQTTAQDFWLGGYDTTTDRFELRTNATAGTNVVWYVDLNGTMSIASGQTYQIDGTQIDIGDLGAAGDWTPTGTINLDSATITLNSDALTVDDGSNYTTISNDAADDTIDELFDAVNTWAAGVGAGSFAALSDTTIAAPAAGHLAIYDGTDSWDNKVVSGDIAITSGGVTTIQADAVESSMIADTAIYTATASKTSVYTIGTDDGKESYGGVIYVTSAAVITAEAVASGMSFTVVTVGAIAVSLDVNASDKMYLDGVLLDDGDKATNTSTTGDLITCSYFSADGWYCASGSPDGDHWTDDGA